MAFKGNQHAAGDPEPTSRKERTSKARKAAGGPGVDEKLNRDVKKSRSTFNVGSGKKCSSCGGTVGSGRKTCQNCGHSFGTLAERIVALESAVIALGAQEFGDSAGHEFHGNQYVVMGSAEAHEEVKNGGSEKMHMAGEKHSALEVESKYAASDLVSRHPGAVSYTNKLDAEHHIALGRVPHIGDVVKGVTRVSEPFFTGRSRTAVAAGAEFAGNPQALRDWYNDGAGGRVDWGEPGDFMKCVDKASEYMTDEQAKGFCNERHQDATGAAPGHAPGEGKK